MMRKPTGVGPLNQRYNACGKVKVGHNGGLSGQPGNLARVVEYCPRLISAPCFIGVDAGNQARSTSRNQVAIITRIKSQPVTKMLMKRRAIDRWTAGMSPHASRMINLLCPIIFISNLRVVFMSKLASTTWAAVNATCWVTNSHSSNERFAA